MGSGPCLLSQHSPWPFPPTAPYSSPTELLFFKLHSHSCLPMLALPFPCIPLSYSTFRRQQLEPSCLYLRTGMSIYLLKSTLVGQLGGQAQLCSHKSLSVLVLALSPLHCHCLLPCLTSPLCYEICECGDQFCLGHHSIPRTYPKDFKWM